MPGYTTPITVYYCKQTENPGPQHRIAPAPQISISPEIYYTNDSVIGYTYNITLSGYANALRKDLDAASTDYGLEPTVDHIGHIRDIFNVNGGNLYLKQENQTILVAKGCTIKNIQFETSDNRWVNYSPFKIELEFNEVDLSGCSSSSAINCASSIFHQANLGKIISDDLINITNYKIKQFSDKWTFNIDNQIYENYNGKYNNIFRVTYTISATGKNYYVNDNLVPAWQQARLFVQDKLYKQVYGLINGQLQIDASSSCEATKDITDLHSVDTSAPRSSGLLDGFTTFKDGVPTYDIYNEKITCSTSESDGTFSVTYEATVKKYDPSDDPNTNAAIHTYNKKITVNSDQGMNTTISVDGTIQGLVRGGFINYSGNDFILPQNGTFITYADGNETKYSNAYNHFINKVGSKTDLLESMKDFLNIKKSQLLINGDDGYPIPSTFNLDHNYFDGTISYNAVYEKSLATSIEKGYTNVSIVRQDPIDIIQEFVVPGRARGPIIQKLNMKSSRTVSVTIDGASPSNTTCDISNICNLIPNFSIENFEMLLQENNKWVKTKEDYTLNPLDGSYNIALEYTLRNC